MKKEHKITLSVNPITITHSLKRIVGYYYKEYLELNDKFENMSEDEYSKMMIAKGEKAKTEKERNKIAKEYAEKKGGSAYDRAMNFSEYVYEHDPNYKYDDDD